MCGAKPKPGFWERLKQKALNAMPEATLDINSKTLNKMKKYDESLSHPAKNRLIMGVTALTTQPVIDFYNHKVDEDTRVVSRNRTIAKILAGTSVGIVVRGSCYSLVEKMTDIKGKGRFSKALMPTKHLKELLKEPKLLKNYRSALSTGIAILAMCFTNFAIDAPLTVFLTNHFKARRAEKLKEERRVLNA